MRQGNTGKYRYFPCNTAVRETVMPPVRKNRELKNPIIPFRGHGFHFKCVKNQKLRNFLRLGEFFGKKSFKPIIGNAHVVCCMLYVVCCMRKNFLPTYYLRHT